MAMPTNTTEKRKKSLVPDIKLTEESLLELKRRVGPPKISFRKKR